MLPLPFTLQDQTLLQEISLDTSLQYLQYSMGVEDECQLRPSLAIAQPINKVVRVEEHQIDDSQVVYHKSLSRAVIVSNIPSDSLDIHLSITKSIHLSPKILRTSTNMKEVRVPPSHHDK